MTASPPLEAARADQRPALERLLEELAAIEHDPIETQRRVDEFAGILGSVAPTDGDLIPLAEELRRWVWWWRAPAYGATYVLQYLTAKRNSPLHPLTALIHSDAQAACGQDMSLSSVEVAWNTQRRFRASPPELAGLAESVATAIEQSLRDHHGYYARWSRPFDYLACSPLTDHLANIRVSRALRQAVPGISEAFLIGTPVEQARTMLASAADDAEAAGDVWSTVVARRFAAGLAPSEEAEEILAGCLNTAQSVGLEAEIGHLLRQRAWHLKMLHRPDESAALLEESLHCELPASLFGFWLGLSLRELGDVRGDQAGAAHRAGDQEAVQRHYTRAADAYQHGRLMLDLALRAGGPAVATTVHRQMLRSYADNAIRVALSVDRAKDAVAEIESTGPCELAASIAETRAALALPPGQAAEFLRARATFAEQVSSAPSTFEDYAQALPASYAARHAYQRVRMGLKLGHDLGSDAVVDRLLATDTTRLIVCLYLGPRDTNSAVVIEPSTGAVLHVPLGWRDEALRALSRQHRDTIATAPTDPSVTRPALDRFIDGAGQLLRPLVEILARGDGETDLTIIPRLEFSALPWHALPVGNSGGERLIDRLASITYAPSLGVLTELLELGAWPQHDAGVTLVRTSATPVFRATAHRLAQERTVDELVDPDHAQALAALAERPGADVVFGCHGRFVADHPTSSSLTIGPGPDLTLADLASAVALPRTRCIALAACESGVARSTVGSEHLGLPGTLLSAGARSVIANLWKVDRTSTAYLIGECLARMADGTPPGKALKAAQLATRALTRDTAVEWAEQHLPEAAVAVEALVADRPDHPYDHPDDWAGPMVVGAC